MNIVFKDFQKRFQLLLHLYIISSDYIITDYPSTS